ncbi:MULTISPECIES: ergothioneine biosynthesis protein EgtB [Flavobacterium]|jgi:ergothioneine biosynthesis protein EgtB|uniref:ergothioneine biosynthesis protein EgtB n=1 Tax=Flavobacterium TaxID=237 RepID=UPI000AE98080|nr:ergothioneine biosynthesis protein EgtB [Flavobacterium johnsoniae]MBX9808732.1 ergothioneine biosynthesis protein EgtB [Flavobacteriaceae bacterium]TXI90634.1 MAG: ergothioneine biosynthesis protein EgtB [Chryseobacterium sp.]
MIEIITDKFIKTRKYSEELCEPLLTEDYSVQPIEFVSPPKWHLAHTTWFWEEFVLTKYKKGYKVFKEEFSFLFNSYYNNVGKRVIRPSRGLMTRPSVDDVYQYRLYVTQQMIDFLGSNPRKEILDIVAVGINHEEQHQELFIYDIKYIFGNQPLFPIYNNKFQNTSELKHPEFIKIDEGLYTIGHQEESFCFDNELGVHKVFIPSFEISSNLVTNKEYIKFIEEGGYQNFNFWHDEGWHWANNNKIEAPLYWHKIDGEWYHYDLNGLEKIELDQPVQHISFYEAFAFAEYKGMRLPTEFEWEVASEYFSWGKLWEWTSSAYLPYPNFSKATGALGEYNGKFMVNQMVLRGASIATPKNHSRKTYRNFFQTNMRWQYCGLRLIKI